MNLLHLNDLRKIKTQLHSEFADELRMRFRVILLRDPRSPQELGRLIHVSVRVVNSFIQGLQRTHFKSLCKIEAWIKSEEHRLGIV